MCVSTHRQLKVPEEALLPLLMELRLECDSEEQREPRSPHTSQGDILELSFILSPLRDNVQESVKMEIHALVNSGVSDSSTFLN